MKLHLDDLVGMNGAHRVRATDDDAKQEIYSADFDLHDPAAVDAFAEAVEKIVGAPETADSIRGMIAARVAGELRPVTLGKLWESDPELREVVLGDLLRRGQVGNLISTSKSYKTYLMLALAICMATRRQWLDRFSTIGGRVLIIDLELQRGDITRRTRDIADAMHADLAEVAAGVEVLSLRGRSATIDHIERMLLAVAPRTYSLVIIDPLYKTYPADFDENSNAKMTALYRRWERIAEHLDGALMIVHHGTKGSQAEKRVVDVGSGASAQSRSADAHITLREHAVDDCVVLEARVRSFRPIDPLVLRWAFPLWARELALDPTDLRTSSKKSRPAADPESPRDPAPEPWTVERFVSTFITADPQDKKLVQAKARQAGLKNREIDDLLALAKASGKLFHWSPPGSRTVYLATAEQPLIADPPAKKRRRTK